MIGDQSVGSVENIMHHTAKGNPSAWGTIGMEKLPTVKYGSIVVTTEDTEKTFIRCMEIVFSVLSVVCG